MPTCWVEAANMCLTCCCICVCEQVGKSTGCQEHLQPAAQTLSGSLMLCVLVPFCCSTLQSHSYYLAAVALSQCVTVFNPTVDVAHWALGCQ